MSKFQVIFLLVWTFGQICGGQIFGGGPAPGRHRPQAHGQPQGQPQRGGILRPPAGGGQEHPRGRGIFGGGQGGHVGPGGREGILHTGLNNQNKQQKDRVRVGPIVFDAENLNFDDDDDYANADDDAYRRPQLGLDLSNLFLPLVNFFKLGGKSLETFFSLLEKQANLLLGMYVI